MAKKLAVGQVFRDGPTIHGHEVLIFTGTAIVDHAGNRFFARATFTVNDHAVIGGCHQVNLFVQSLCKRALPNDVPIVDGYIRPSGFNGFGFFYLFAARIDRCGCSVVLGGR